jgi:hypothetical protein
MIAPLTSRCVRFCISCRLSKPFVPEEGDTLVLYDLVGDEMARVRIPPRSTMERATKKHKQAVQEASGRRAEANLGV